MQRLQYKGICHCRYAPLALSGPVRMPSNQLSVRQIRYMQFYFVGEIVVITTIHMLYFLHLICTMKGSISRQVPYGPCRNSPSQSEYILVICAHYIFTAIGCYVELHAVDSPTREVRTAGCGSTGIYQLADHSTIM